jgi:MraZ protein
VVNGIILYFALHHLILFCGCNIGTYECKVDAKGRLLLPAPLKSSCVTSKRFCFEAFRFQPCLELYPMKVDLMMQKNQ